MNRRRSERVMLQMKVTVIAEDIQRKSHQEEAMTLVVNAHGGLLKMKMEVHVGQPMLLVNLQKSVEQNCRVIRVEDTSTEYFSVAFEFNKTRDSVRFGGRSDEVSDERHWRIAASGGIRFDLRAAGRRLRRPRRRGSRFEYPHTQGEHLGLEACRATQGRGPPSRCIA